MEMGRSGNGGGKVLTFDEAVAGRRRNGSLSSYLDIGRDADGGRAAPRPLPLPLPEPALGSRRRTYADGELDVFSAERYFKGAMDGDGGDRKEGAGTPAAVAPPLGLDTAAATARPAEAVVMAKPSGTRASTVSLTASSASSANSRTALFQQGGGHRRRSSRDRRCCVQVGVLMRTCSGKRSVRVDGCGAKEEDPDTAEPAATASSRIDWYRELRMQKASLGLGFVAGTAVDGNNSHGLPPSLNLGTAKVAAIGREVTRDEKEKAAELSDSTRRSFATLVAPVRASVPAASGRIGGDPAGVGVVGIGGGDDADADAGSESSSDLFEIKSLMIDECPYEPSEVSIQWSVVTASAAGASERGGDRASARWATSGGRVPVAGGRLPRDHRPVGLLAGCASHRAVDVSAATKAVPNAAAVQRRMMSEGFQKARNGA